MFSSGKKLEYLDFAANPDLIHQTKVRSYGLPTKSRKPLLAKFPDLSRAGEIGESGVLDQ